MKIDFSQYLYNLNGEVFTDEGTKPISLGALCLKALDTTFSDEPHLSGSDKYARFELMAMIRATQGVAEVSDDEAALLKYVTGKLYSIAAVGAIYDIFNGKDRGNNKTTIAALPASSSNNTETPGA